MRLLKENDVVHINNVLHSIMFPGDTSIQRFYLRIPATHGSFGRPSEKLLGLDADGLKRLASLYYGHPTSDGFPEAWSLLLLSIFVAFLGSHEDLKHRINQ